MGKLKASLLLTLLALSRCQCFWELLRGGFLLPTDWRPLDLEPRRHETPTHPVVNSRINSRTKDGVLDRFALCLVSARAAQQGRVAPW